MYSSLLFFIYRTLFSWTCVAVRCSALQRVAVRCSVIQCGAVCSSDTVWFQDSPPVILSAHLCSLLQFFLILCVAVCHSVSAVCCSASQCVACVLQCVAVTLCAYKIAHLSIRMPIYAVCCSACCSACCNACCNAVQCVTVCCSVF